MLRTQKGGKQIPWTEDELSSGLRHFYKEYDRYPTSHEIDEYSYLPSSRSIQRRFGGLVSLRIKLGLDGPADFTKGEYSSKRAKKINERARRLEKHVYDFLIKNFGEMCVHREYFFTDDRRTKTDFFVSCKKSNFSFSVDIFYPKDRYSMMTCINSKMQTYGKDIMLQCPVIFLMMNEAITEDDILNFLNNKKEKLYTHQEVMTYPQFKDYCMSKRAL